MHSARLSLALPLALPGAVLALVLSSIPAQAEPGLLPVAPTVPAPAPRVRTERYGLMLGAVDATGVVVAVATDRPGVFVGSYLLAGPVVHLLHRNYRAALASVGLRAALALGGFVVGTVVSDCDWGSLGPLCRPDYIVEGGAIGAASAMLIDSLWLARTTTRVSPEPPALLRAGSLRASPGVQMSRTGGLLLGLEGHF